jgi:hypothetical protein
MEQLAELVGVVIAALFVELARRGGNLLREWMDRQAIIGAAGRGAGQVVAALKADPALAAEMDSLVDKAGVYVATALPGALLRLGVPAATVRGMVMGEVGKLLAGTAEPRGAERQ